MGLDALVFAKGVLTDETRQRLNDRFRDQEWISRDSRAHGDIVIWDTCDRLYDETYERGDWPILHHGIQTLRGVFGNAYYGCADYDDATLVTDGRLADIWAHWLSPAFDRYYVERRAYALATKFTTQTEGAK